MKSLLFVVPELYLQKITKLCKIMYTVYLRENTVNGKQYVGQTEDFKVRNYQWNSLKETYANLFLTEERNQYGLDSFTTQVLAEVETQEEAWELEEYYIKELNTKYPNGYNKSKGGKCAGDALKGIPKTEEHKRKLSEVNKGIPKSEETKRKMGEAHSKPVLQLNKNTLEIIKQWSSTNEVQRQLGYSQANISACCMGKRKSAYGFKWSYIP